MNDYSSFNNGEEISRMLNKKQTHNRGKSEDGIDPNQNMKNLFACKKFKK